MNISEVIKMVEQVIETINQILKEEGLEGVLSLNESMLPTAGGDLLGYKTPPSENGYSVSFISETEAANEERLQVARKSIVSLSYVLELRYLITLCHEVPGSDGVYEQIVVSEDGTLGKTENLDSIPEFKKYCDGIELEKGTDFAPIFRKMVQFYKEHYTP